MINCYPLLTAHPGRLTWLGARPFSVHFVQGKKPKCGGVPTPPHPTPLNKGLRTMPRKSPTSHIGMSPSHGLLPIVQQETNIITNLNNPLFISLCILRDIPQQKNPRALCQGSSPNFICSHLPMEIFLFKKESRKLKESCLRKGRFLYSCVLLRYRNTIRLTPLSAPPSGEHTCVGTSPAT